MAISNEKAHLVSLLQNNLQPLRKLAGWSIEDLAEKIGVSKQTISNLENANTKMSLTQYIAIRAALDYEAQEHPENDVLPKAVHLLLDEEQHLDQDDYAKVKEAINAVAAASTGITNRSTLSTLFTSLIGSLVVSAGLMGGIATACWLQNLFRKE